MRDYEITFWTSPVVFRGGRKETRHFKAKSRDEAVYDAEDMFPDWSIIRVREAEDKGNDEI